jgi:hypothetical protein
MLYSLFVTIQSVCVGKGVALRLDRKGGSKLQDWAGKREGQVF